MSAKICEAELIDFITGELALMLGMPAKDIDADDNFEKFRINSIHAMQLLDELEEKFNLEISPMWLWEYPTIRLLANQLIRAPLK